MSLKLFKMNPEVYRFKNRPPAMEPTKVPLRMAGQAVPSMRPKMSGGSKAMDIADKGVNFVDKLTKFPGRISDLGDRLNDKFISVAEDIQAATSKFSNQGAAAAEKNLKRNKINSLVKNASNWIQDNLALAGGLALGFVVVSFLLMRR